MAGAWIANTLRCDRVNCTPLVYHGVRALRIKNILQRANKLDVLKIVTNSHAEFAHRFVNFTCNAMRPTIKLSRIELEYCAEIAIKTTRTNKCTGIPIAFFVVMPPNIHVIFGVGAFVRLANYVILPCMHDYRHRMKQELVRAGNMADVRDITNKEPAKGCDQLGIAQ